MHLLFIILGKPCYYQRRFVLKHPQLRARLNQTFPKHFTSRDLLEAMQLVYFHILCREIVSKSRTGANATALATYETFKALPSPQQPYTQYDFSILADIIRTAESNAARARLKGTGMRSCVFAKNAALYRNRHRVHSAAKQTVLGYQQSLPCTITIAGSGLMTLQVVLKAYEAVLPKYGVSPDHDTYYYRLLLKLSLDSHPDWWGKLNREALATGRCEAHNYLHSCLLMPSTPRPWHLSACTACTLPIVLATLHAQSQAQPMST